MYKSIKTSTLRRLSPQQPTSSSITTLTAGRTSPTSPTSSTTTTTTTTTTSSPKPTSPNPTLSSAQSRSTSAHTNNMAHPLMNQNLWQPANTAAFSTQPVYAASVAQTQAVAQPAPQPAAPQPAAMPVPVQAQAQERPRPLRSASSMTHHPRITPKHTQDLAHVPNPNSHFDTSLSQPVRKFLHTYGLTPPVIESYETQKKRCLHQLNSKTTSIDKFLYLSALRHNNVHLFYRLLTDHFTEITPLVYTPVVGEACQRWSEIYQQPEGMYLSFSDRGNLANMIRNWPQDKVEITCITDGSRILGLGDLGINGMGIPIGKLALYTACAGIRPEATLPLTVDLGTSNKAFREDPFYLGSRREKVTHEEEIAFLDELMAALKGRWPDIVIQFEDWKNPFPSLERYRYNYSMFNDDIQGTGAVIMGGIIGAVKQSGIAPQNHRAVFLGSGSAGVGVAKQIVDYFVNEGLTEDEAKRCFWLVDSKGLVALDRGDKLAEHKYYFARDDNHGQQFKTLEEVCDYVKPTIIMGLSTIGGAFKPELLQKMGAWNQRPIIFPLSNPISKSECTFEQAIINTDGRALFASGSPFPAFTYKGKTLYPGQGNNMYVFPGIGLGAILCKSTQVTSNMIFASGEAVPTMITEAEKEMALLYPQITRIRDVSARVALYVIRAAQQDGVDRVPILREMSDALLEAWIKEQMYDPHKQSAVLEREVLELTTGLSTGLRLGNKL